MIQYKIQGDEKLRGEVSVSGNKNSVFPVVAAALLTQEEVILENISNLRDTEILIQILKKLGVGVKREGSTLTVNASDIKTFSLPRELMVKLRGSIVLVGAIFSRKNRATFYHPGGDIIGQRSIETHLEGFKQLGAVLKRNDLKFSLQNIQSSGTYSIFLPESSVTACENLILASVLGNKTVTLKNCPIEPHILDLCQVLIQMGADISGVGTNVLRIRGVEKLHGTRFRIGADYIEIGTYIIASVITGGQVTIKGIDQTDLDPLLIPLSRFGVQLERKEESIAVLPSKLKSIPKLITNIWPGFPTDLMSAAIVLATQSKGITLCHDWMYESRMFFVDKLISMGAKISLADPHRVFVYGPSRLRGRILETPDIRAGMALVLAALTAKGESVINQAELIERGYENVVGKLRNLGVKIERREI